MDASRTVLTARETELARLAANGLTAQGVAKRLCIAQDTVKTHLRHVYAKLGVRNRAELTRAVFEMGENHPNG